MSEGDDQINDAIAGEVSRRVWADHDRRNRKVEKSFADVFLDQALARLKAAAHCDTAVTRMLNHVDRELDDRSQRGRAQFRARLIDMIASRQARRWKEKWCDCFTEEQAP